jgi:hypothetical protein
LQIDLKSASLKAFKTIIIQLMAFNEVDTRIYYIDIDEIPICNKQ